MYELRKRVWRFYFYGRNPRVVYFVGNRILCRLVLIRGTRPGRRPGLFFLNHGHPVGGVRCEPLFWHFSRLPTFLTASADE